VVDDPRAVLGELAAHVYGHPSHTVQVIGVTGTNGKTTTTYFLDAGLRAAGHRTALVGTIETRVGDRRLPSAHNHARGSGPPGTLALMRERRSTRRRSRSPATASPRAGSTGRGSPPASSPTSRTTTWDFHGDMAGYWAAKSSLFDEGRCGVAIVDIDDIHGARLARCASPPS